MKKNTDEQATGKLVVRLSGTGGQGLLRVGRVLAEAAAIYDGLTVVQTNSYGPEARGGASRSEVTLGRGTIDDLRSLSVDVLVCLSQQACDSYYPDLASGGLLIVDSTNVTVVPTSRAVEVPMTELAIQDCGNKMTANVISLGVLAGCSGLVSQQAIRSAIEANFAAKSSKLVDLNLKALDLGFQAGKQVTGRMAETAWSLVHGAGKLYDDSATQTPTKPASKTSWKKKTVSAKS